MTQPSVDWLDEVPDVAARFKVTEATVRRWVNEGKLQAHRIPRQRDANADFDPRDLRTKYRPADQSKSTLYFTYAAQAEWGKTFYKIGVKK